MQVSKLFPPIGMAICGKQDRNHVHMQLFWKQPRMTPRTKIFMNLMDILVNFSCRMVLEWREREHGDVEEAVRAERMAQEALRRCGLYKFWCLGGLRAKLGLLQMLVDYWDPYSESFRLDGMSLTIEVEDIYFITGLSRRGEMVNLRARGGPCLVNLQQTRL